MAFAQVKAGLAGYGRMFPGTTHPALDKYGRDPDDGSKILFT